MRIDYICSCECHFRLWKTSNHSGLRDFQQPNNNKKNMENIRLGASHDAAKTGPEMPL